MHLIDSTDIYTMDMPMNGAESLITAAIKGGIEVCFANAGTTEVPLVAALDTIPGLTAYLGLHENVCTGAADGYGRMTEKPAMTLLHLGPGLANGLANLHNARRARAPMLVIVGEHATWHRPYDAPLTMDIESIATTASDWVRTSESTDDITRDTHEAITVANSPPGKVATLIVPHNHQWSQANYQPALVHSSQIVSVDENRVKDSIAALRRTEKVLLFLGGRALHGRGLEAAGRIARATGCDVACETFPARLERGQGRQAVVRLPYFPNIAQQYLGTYASVILAGAKSPVTFFGYDGVASQLIDPSINVVNLVGPEENVVGSLEAVADSMPKTPSQPMEVADRTLPEGALTPESLATALAFLQPEDAIVVETAATTGSAYFSPATDAPPHTYMALTGGAIGQGPANTVGAAIACPERKVINFQADGSAAYTVQALWNQGREGLNVTTIICANRNYRIIEMELANSGVQKMGPNARALTSLDPIDWTCLAKGFGVPACAVDTVEDFSDAFVRAISEPGPMLIQANI